MGILTTLLTLPVSGPVRATTWVAEQIVRAAEEEMEEESVRRAHRELGLLRDAGAGAAELAAAEDQLAEELLARRRVERPR